LNELTKMQMKGREPMPLEYGGKQYSVPRKNITAAMQNLSTTWKNEQLANKTVSELEIQEVSVGGKVYRMPRWQQKDFYKALSDQQGMDIARVEEAREAQKEKERLQGMEALGESSEQVGGVSAQTAAQTGALPTWLSKMGEGGGDSAAQQNADIRMIQAQDKINMTLQDEGDEEAALGLAENYNDIGARLGRGNPMVVFTSRQVIEGLGNDIKRGSYPVENITHPTTGKPLSIQDLKEIAQKNGKTLNEVLQAIMISRANEES